MRVGISIVFALLTGCGQLADWQDKLEGYTNPLVAQAMFLGIAEPESEFIDLGETEFSAGAAMQVFLADATNASDLEQAPLSGGAIQVQVGQAPSLPLIEIDAGAYQVTGEEGLYYEEGQDTRVSIGIEGETSRISGRLPEAAQVSLDFYLPEGQGLEVDLSNNSFEAVMAVVIDMADGEVVWSNEPQDISTLYEMTHGDGPVTQLSIPYSPFQVPSIYAVGVAGMMVTEQEELENVNIVLSAYMQGQLVFTPVCTFSEASCASITPEQFAGMN